MKNKNICLVFLGDFYKDARCINMSLSILSSNKYSLSVISISKKNINPIFKNITFYSLNISQNRFFKFIDFHKKARHIINNNAFDTCIAGDIYSLSAVCNQGARVIYDAREIYSQLAAHVKKPIHRWFWYQYERFHLNFISHIMVTANSDLLYLRNLYSNYSLNFSIIFNYPCYQKYKKTNVLHAKLNLPNNKKIILYQGAVHRGRGIKQLINLVARTKKYVAVIIGGGPDQEYYYNFVKNNHLASRVYFIKSLPYLGLFLYTASADVGWLVIQSRGTSNKFALPNKLFEYILMGLPVVASNVKNIAHLVDKHNLGIVVKNEKGVIDHLDALRQIETNNFNSLDLHSICINNFIWDLQADDFLRLIKNDA